MMNVVNLQGRVTAKPKLRQTNTGKSVADFCLAVARNSNTAGTDFINLVAWNKTAELVAEHLEKGQMVTVEARLQSRTVPDKDDPEKTRTLMDVVAHQVHFCDSKPAAHGDGADEEPEDGE